MFILQKSLVTYSIFTDKKMGTCYSLCGALLYWWEVQPPFVDGLPLASAPPPLVAPPLTALPPPICTTPCSIATCLTVGPYLACSY